MGGVAALSGLIWYGWRIVLAIIFAGLAIKNRRSKAKVIIYVLLVAGVLTSEVLAICDGHENQRRLTKEYSGFYKLETLDRVECSNCQVRLDTDYSYVIFKGEQIVGKGKWEVGVSGETGPYVDIDQLHGMMIWPSPRVISAMNTN